MCASVCVCLKGWGGGGGGIIIGGVDYFFFLQQGKERVVALGWCRTFEREREWMVRSGKKPADGYLETAANARRKASRRPRPSASHRIVGLCRDRHPIEIHTAIINKTSKECNFAIPGGRERREARDLREFEIEGGLSRERKLYESSSCLDISKFIKNSEKRRELEIWDWRFSF